MLAVLDSKALAALAFPRERARASRRTQAVLVTIERLGGWACVPAPVIAELARWLRVAQGSIGYGRRCPWSTPIA